MEDEVLGIRDWGWGVWCTPYTTQPRQTSYYLATIEWEEGGWGIGVIRM